jgi:hypothetical protein
MLTTESHGKAVGGVIGEKYDASSMLCAPANQPRMDEETTNLIISRGLSGSLPFFDQ